MTPEFILGDKVGFFPVFPSFLYYLRIYFMETTSNVVQEDAVISS